MSNLEMLPIELQKLGLSAKESRTYLASLTLGNATASQISKKIGHSRPTTYRLLASLEQKGLIGKVNQGGKNFFIASSPENFLNILKVKRKEAEEQEREFLRIISILQNEYVGKKKNHIKIYKGKREIKILFETFENTLSKKSFIAFSTPEYIWPNKLLPIYKNIRKRLGPITIKEIYPKKVHQSALDYVFQKQIPSIGKFPPLMIIISDKLLIIRKNEGFCIEQNDLVNLAKTSFESFWNLN